jgi:hypothetical protein
MFKLGVRVALLSQKLYGNGTPFKITVSPPEWNWGVLSVIRYQKITFCIILRKNSSFGVSNAFEASWSCPERMKDGILVDYLPCSPWYLSGKFSVSKNVIW